MSRWWLLVALVASSGGAQSVDSFAAPMRTASKAAAEPCAELPELTDLSKEEDAIYLGSVQRALNALNASPAAGKSTVEPRLHPSSSSVPN